jgi:hypothetical protein
MRHGGEGEKGEGEEMKRRPYTVQCDRDGWFIYDPINKLRVATIRIGYLGQMDSSMSMKSIADRLNAMDQQEEDDEPR